MIYSVAQHKEVPVIVTKETNFIDYFSPDETVYSVHDASDPKTMVGYVKLIDEHNGVKVTYIKNKCPDLYRHFGQVADQIELEHCLNRGIKNPHIRSTAAVGTYVQHFKRGKRFINEGINIYLEELIKNLSKGEKAITGFFGYQKMYMPMNLINELKEKIKINPLLKSLK